MKSIAMLQSNYIPWKGVFDLIHKVDIFVFYDDVQYTKKDWRNRNKIPTKDGELWLSVPVQTKGKYSQLVCEAKINRETDWQLNHYKTLTQVYKKAPYFEQNKYILDDFYINHEWGNLSEMNVYMTMKLSNILGINTEFVYGPDLHCEGNKNGEKVINICNKLGCDFFINGPASRAFMDEQLFSNAGITLKYMEYKYPRYEQLVKPFNHFVSILDLIFNTGPDAPHYIWDINPTMPIDVLG